MVVFNDPIAELLTKIRNAKSAQKCYVDIFLSRKKLNIIKVLKDRGFISNFLVNESKRKVRIFLKYKLNRDSIITNLKRVSKSSFRKYTKCKDIPKVFGGLGVAILSTSKGVIDDDTARSMKVGGEILCYVW